MILFVTGVGTLIHLYSIGYMHGDPRFSRFFAYLNLFAASMLVLVLGIELPRHVPRAGRASASAPTCSISFWFERNSAAVAGKKAFVTNRVGDFGFMLAMFLIFSKVGTLDYSALDRPRRARSRRRHGHRDRAAALPRRDGQERAVPAAHLAARRDGGPHAGLGAHPRRDDGDRRRVPRRAARTRSSTLLATTRARSSRGSARSPRSFAATVAIVQNDIKRVLAYSTISQLGYMFLAVGVGAYSAAIFHMITHAFFKALLFLGAGSVIHGMHDEQDMRRMGGLRKYMPITAVTFIVGWLAIAGVFPFAGFWSKDEILAKAWFDARLRAVGGRRRRRAVHRVLHDPPGVAGLLRPRALATTSRARWRRRATTVHAARAARVAVDDDDPARRARRARRSVGGRHQPAVHEAAARLPRPLARAGARAAQPEIDVDVVRRPAFALSTVALVDRGRRHRRRARASTATGSTPTATDPTVERLGGSPRCSRTRTTSTSASRGS